MSIDLAYELEYEVCSENENNAIPVIIVAGGSSTRMGGVDKIRAEILGMSVIARTLLAFENSKFVSKIVVVTKEDNIEFVQEMCDRYSISKLLCITKGGKNRAKSVLNGLNCLPKNTKNVLIHDGARPLVSDEVIKRVVSANEKYKCVICSVPVCDTIKSVNNEIIEKTIDRSKLISVQTPQRVDYSSYLPILTAENELKLYTDDASFMEQNGYEVLNVLGDYRNIKITTKLDLIIAKSLLEDVI